MHIMVTVLKLIELDTENKSESWVGLGSWQHILLVNITFRLFCFKHFPFQGGLQIKNQELFQIDYCLKASRQV